MSHITNETLQRLRDIPIEEVAQQLGLHVTRHKALCPFHQDKHPSLSFHVRRNTYKCFVCNAHGGTIDLTMQVLGKDFKEACQWLSGEYRVDSVEFRENRQPKKSGLITHNSKLITEKYSKYFIHPFLNAPARQFLFDERRLNPRVIDWCRVTSWTDRYGTSWLQIPYFDVDGTLIGVQSRRLSPCHPELVSESENPQRLNVSTSKPRFIFPTGSRISIYNLPILKHLKEGEALWITEGCSDCWAMLSAGRKAIAIPSATLLNAKDLDVLKAHCPWLIATPSKGGLHMSPDNDEPGEQLYLQIKNLFPQLERHPLPHGIKDFGQYWAMSDEL